MNQEIRKQFEDELNERWNGNQRMVSYCLRKAQVVVRTSKGYLIEVERPSIKKSFCFGESGYDYGDACEMARHARTSQEYFIDENIKELKEAIIRLEDLNMPAYAQKRSGKGNIRSLAVIEPGRLYSYPWKWELDQGNLDELTYEDRQLLIKAYESVLESFMKRLNSYLKRYGMEHVHAWTYWRDA